MKDLRHGSLAMLLLGGFIIMGTLVSLDSKPGNNTLKNRKKLNQFYSDFDSNTHGMVYIRDGAINKLLKVRSKSPLVLEELYV